MAIRSRAGYNAPAMSAKPATPLTHTERAEQFLIDLNELFAEASKTGSSPELLQRVLTAGVAAVAGSRGFLALVNRESGELRIVATYGPGWTEEGRALRLNLAHEKSRGISGHVAVTGQPYITSDV